MQPDRAPESPEPEPAINTIDGVLDFYRNKHLRWWLRLKTTVGQLPTTLFLPLFKNWRPASILEIGCGYGLLSNCLSVEFPQARIKGIDIDAGRIRQAELTVGERKNISFALQDALTYTVGEWDCIILVDVIHHVPRKYQEQLIKKCHSLLKAGGRLLIREVDPEANFVKTLLTHVFECTFYMQICKTLTLTQLRTYLSNAGFSQIDIHKDMPQSPVFPYVTYMASAPAENPTQV